MRSLTSALSSILTPFVQNSQRIDVRSASRLRLGGSSTSSLFAGSSASRSPHVHSARLLKKPSFLLLSRLPLFPPPYIGTTISPNILPRSTGEDPTATASILILTVLRTPLPIT